MRRLGTLFAESAQRFNAQHVALFDGVLKGLLVETDGEARAELASCLACLVNAPPAVVCELVHDDEIRVSGPLLRSSPLVGELMLVELAEAKSQQHLLAISQRPEISGAVTDVILRRGERDVVRSVAHNATAAFSTEGYSGLVQRAADDGMLAVAVGQRADLPAPLLQQLLRESVDLVRRKMFQAAHPACKARIAQAIVELSTESDKTPRNYAQAQRAIVELQRTARLDQDAVVQFASARRLEETVAALAAISGLSLEAVDQLVTSGKRDQVLILGRALEFEWATVRLLLMLRLGPGRMLSATDAEDARISFERLALSIAQRMLKFWRDRGSSD
ncbi:DUF2336 domain-containing protein [Bradyrhizobium sp. LHD-71]|uniref:DUF2336 domain-containing protein n=1 Tax=Bradyrhizobium sp. LHD-71 TaxID=3072141 RepID=UPI00280E8F9A|nr:DUF2336 domain-containing protein [Bradyrhizobium sp. LHD-71]MDQ8731954.1 DUF2336 domain-containing protein [Bradyrhizobium sp. LHD-71]